ncbi:MAG: TraB/GumN family protein [Chthoniobacterales bacterium]
MMTLSSSGVIRCATAILATLAFSRVANADPAIWVIRDADSTIYLIGTMHLLKHETEWNRAKVMGALAASEELWLEIADPTNQAVALPLIQRYGFDPQHRLSSKLSAAEQEKLSRVAAQYHMAISTLDPMRPWMAAMILSELPLQSAGYDPNAGVDMILKAEAEKRGEKVLGFETMEDQIRFLADLPEPIQIEFLESTLDEVSKGLALVDALAKAWVNGDTKTIDELGIEEVRTKEPEVYDKLLVRRNVQWSEKITELLKRSGVQLIAVGAAHLVGPDSVQAQLAKRGIRVETF